MIASAVLVAAGRGTRMAADARKGFLELAGRPLFMHAAETFLHIPRVEEIIVVVHSNDVDAARDATSGLIHNANIVVGGSTRRESSLAGVRAARGEIVLIHDACRPFASPDLINQVLDQTLQHRAAVPVLPSIETLYRVSGDGGDRRIQAVLDRTTIARAQTPQGFRRSLILECLESADPTITDDASAVAAHGDAVFTVDGEISNLKITYPEDLRWAEAFAVHFAPRTA